MPLILKSIHIYPIKSLGGISLQRAEIDLFGLKYDRRWMLINEKNEFISQREYPLLNQLTASMNNDFLVVSNKQNLSSIELPLNIDLTIIKKVGVWSSVCKVLVYPSDVNDWFSDYLNTKVELVYMPESSNRRVDSRYAKNKEKTSFTDGFPFLIIGEESLNFLNAKLSTPVYMEQFRPNFVFLGGEAHTEDEWNLFSIGSTVFKRVKPCSRCVVTTFDLETSLAHKEPLKTLATYRKQNNKIYFGQNLLKISGNEVNVGDIITPLHQPS